MPENVNFAELDKFNPRDTVIPITYALADLKKLGDRNGTTTKTIKLPGSKKNDTVFSSYYNPNAEGFFDVNKQQRTFLKDGSSFIIEGGLHLLQVSTNSTGSRTYEVMLLSNNAEWFDLIKGHSLRELIFATINFDAATIENSWSKNSDTSDFVYSYIDYGRIANKNRITETELDDFRPGVYIVPIVRQMFKNIGFQIDEGFFQNRLIKNAYLAFTTGDLKLDREIQDRQFAHVNVNRPVSLFDIDGQIQLLDNGVNNVVNYENIVQDTEGNYNFAIAKYEVPFTGTYTIKAEVKGAVKKKFTQTSYTVVQTILHGGTTAESSQSFTFGGSGTDLGLGNTVTPYQIPLNGPEEVSLTKGDTIEVLIRVEESVNQFGLQFSQFVVTPKLLEFSIGGKIDLSKSLPDMDQRDFIKGLIDAFNLIPNTNNRNRTVKFQTWDMFFKGITDAEDWTDLLDTDRDQIIEQVTESVSKTLEFKWKDDSGDAELEKFEDNNSRKFGNDTEVLDNEFLKGKTTIANLPFASTIMERAFGGSMYMPTMKKDFTAVNTFDFEARLLIYAGLRDSPTFNFNGTPRTQYPYSYFTPDIGGREAIDLDFSSQATRENIPGGLIGLKDRYYRTQINQINEGKFATFFIRLNNSDISKIDFTKPKKIGNAYWYINKIIDYKPGADESTEVEFIQMIE